MSKAKFLKENHEVWTSYEYGSVDSFKHREGYRINRNNKSEGVLHFEFLKWMADYFPQGLPDNSVFGVAGPTGVGKSLMMANVALEGMMPHNKLDVVAIIAENRYIDWATRCDAMLMDVPIDDLKSAKEENLEHQKFYDNLGKIMVG